MDWVRGSKLGQGSFSAVSLAVPGKHSASFLPPLMAVKSCGASHSASLAKEKMILDELRDCAQVIQCFGDDFTCENGERLYNVLLEYAPGGSLHDKITNSDEKKLPEIEVRRYTKAMLRGLGYIHKVGYVHCDIKLQNILLCADGSVKIADFGLAKKGSNCDGRRRCELRGTPLYMSPEMVTVGEQGPQADVWALGCVVAEMVSGAPSWMCATPAEMLMKIGVGDELPAIPATLSDNGRDFLERCFVRDPKKRWTAKMLLDHPFVRGQDFDFNFDQNDGYGFAGGLCEKDELPSPSPRCPFDFPNWASSSIDTCSVMTSLPSPGTESWSSWSDVAAERLRGLVSQRGPNWSDSDDWVTIR